MSINFNDPRTGSQFRNLRHDTFATAEYEQAIKGLVRQILQYFFDDAEFVMLTTMGADAIFVVKMGEGKKPKKTISVYEAPSTMSMMSMMFMNNGEKPFKSENEISAWRFGAYLDLYKKLQAQYPDGPTSVFGQANNIINKFKESLDSPKKENQIGTSEDKKVLDWDEKEFLHIPFPPGWEHLAHQRKLPNRSIGESELRHELIEMKVSFNPQAIPPAQPAIDYDYEEALQQVLDDCNFSGYEDAVMFSRKCQPLVNFSKTLADFEGNIAFDAKIEVLKIMQKVQQYLNENPVKIFVKGQEHVLKDPDIKFQEANDKDFWYIKYYTLEENEVVIFMKNPETLYITGDVTHVSVE